MIRIISPLGLILPLDTGWLVMSPHGETTVPTPAVVTLSGRPSCTFRSRWFRLGILVGKGFEARWRQWHTTPCFGHFRRNGGAGFSHSPARSVLPGAWEGGAETRLGAPEIYRRPTLRRSPHPIERLTQRDCDYAFSVRMADVLATGSDRLVLRRRFAGLVDEVL
jgi:hypothetical protein